MWSCSKKDSGPVIIYQESRDNHMNVMDKLVSIENKLPDMRAFTLLTMAGDTIIFHDNRADLQFTAYDIYADTTIGRFGKYGNGPGEIANFGAEFYDHKSKILYGRNGNRHMLMGFYLPDAVSDPHYNAFDKCKMNFFECPFIGPNYLNDSTIFCSILIPEGTAESQLGMVNLNTQKITLLDSVTYYDNARFLTTIDTEKNRIYAADRKQDVISIYSLDGKLLRRIFGPDYTDKPDKRYRAFSRPEICKDKIIMRYSGYDALTPTKVVAEKLIVSDLNGNYIKTLDFDFTIHDIAYHAKTNRLYLATDGEPQFCYLNLSDLKL